MLRLSSSDASSRPTACSTAENGTFSSWPDSALVAGVKIGVIRSLSISPTGMAWPHTTPLATYSFQALPER